MVDRKTRGEEEEEMAQQAVVTMIGWWKRRSNKERVSKRTCKGTCIML